MSAILPVNNDFTVPYNIPPLPTIVVPARSPPLAIPLNALLNVDCLLAKESSISIISLLYPGYLLFS